MTAIQSSSYTVPSQEFRVHWISIGPIANVFIEIGPIANVFIEIGPIAIGKNSVGTIGIEPIAIVSIEIRHTITGPITICIELMAVMLMLNNISRNRIGISRANSNRPRTNVMIQGIKNN